MPTFFNYPDLQERLIVLDGWSKAYDDWMENGLECVARKINSTC